jgi:hypothetical protein
MPISILSCRSFFAIWLWLCMPFGSYAQQSIEALYSPSTHLQLGNRNTFSRPQYPWLAGLSYRLDMSRLDKPWYRYWQRPQLSLDAIYLSTGLPEVLGYGIGLYPSIRFRIVEYRGILLSSSMGTGLAYLSRSHDKLSNPQNNAIAAPISNITRFDIRSSLHVHQRLTAHLGYQLTHLSNARTVTPNTGLNYHGWQLGLQYQLDRRARSIDTTSFTATLYRRWGGEAMVAYGLSQYSFTGGTYYNTYHGHVGLVYRWSPYLLTILGAEYEYSQSVYQFHNQDFDPPSVAHAKAKRTSASLAQVLRFGYVSVRMQAGYYLPYPTIRVSTNPTYFLLGVGIHPLQGRYPTDPYMMIYLKSHKAVAQYLGFAAGITI